MARYTFYYKNTFTKKFNIFKINTVFKITNND